MSAPLFLRAKHWQIFVPLLVIPFVSMIIFSIVVVGTIINSRPNGPEDILWIFYFMPVLMLLNVATQFLWQWNVAVKLRNYIQSDERKPRIKLFRITFFFPLVLFCLMPILFVNFFDSVGAFEPRHINGSVPVNPGSMIGFMLLMMLTYVVLFFCLLNNNYVVAKTIKMAELQRRVVFSDFAGDFFFMLFVFPIAIWFIQPRINKVVSQELRQAGLGNEDLLD